MNWPTEDELILDTGCVVVTMRFKDRERVQEWYTWMRDAEIFPIAGTSGGGMGKWYGTFNADASAAVLTKLVEFFPDNS